MLARSFPGVKTLAGARNGQNGHSAKTMAVDKKLSGKIRKTDENAPSISWHIEYVRTMTGKGRV